MIVVQISYSTDEIQSLLRNEEIYCLVLEDLTEVRLLLIMTNTRSILKFLFIELCGTTIK